MNCSHLIFLWLPLHAIAASTGNVAFVSSRPWPANQLESACSLLASYPPAQPWVFGWAPHVHPRDRLFALAENQFVRLNVTLAEFEGGFINPLARPIELPLFRFNETWDRVDHVNVWYGTIDYSCKNWTSLDDLAATVRYDDSTLHTGTLSPCSDSNYVLCVASLE